MKRLLSLVLVLMLMLSALPALAGYVPEEVIGKAVPDFTFTDTDGVKVTLSELLKEREVVVVSLFATWCGPCKNEFPMMKQIMEKYPDQLEVLAVSAYDGDTMEKLAKFKETLDLPFHFGRDEEAGLRNFVEMSYYPTNLFIDRFGNVGFCSDIPFPAAELFERTVQAFMGDDYTQTVTLSDIPQPEMNVERPDSETLSAALNAVGADLTFESSTEEGVFPFVPRMENGRNLVYASNMGIPNTISAFKTHVTAEDGDALSFQVNSHAVLNAGVLTVSVDDVTVKKINGSHSWKEYTIPLTAGEHDVVFSYAQYIDAGDNDFMSIDAVCQTGKRFPFGSFSATLLNENQRDTMILSEGHATGVTAVLVQDPIMHFALSVDSNTDPDAAFFYYSSTREGVALSQLPCEYGTYFYECPAPKPGEIAMIQYCQSISDPDVEEERIYYASDEAGIQAYVDEYTDQGIEGLSWAYVDELPADAMLDEEADEDDEAGEEEPEAEVEIKPEAESETEATYTVTVLDQNGDPVPGAAVGFCLESGCVPVDCDENGVATYKAAPNNYHIKVIDAPEEYDYPDDTDIYTDTASGSYTLYITKD